MRIANFLKSLPLQAREGSWEWKRGRWTTAIKKELRNIGHDLGYKIGANEQS